MKTYKVRIDPFLHEERIQADSLVISPTGAAVFYTGNTVWCTASGSIMGEIVKVIAKFNEITLDKDNSSIPSLPGACGKEYRKGPVSGLPIFCTRPSGHEGECAS